MSRSFKLGDGNCRSQTAWMLLSNTKATHPAGIHYNTPHPGRHCSCEAKTIVLVSHQSLLIVDHAGVITSTLFVSLQGKVKEFFVQSPFSEVSGTKLLHNLPQPAAGKEPVEGFSSHLPQVRGKQGLLRFVHEVLTAAQGTMSLPL